MANRGINKVILIGNLGQDPEIRHMPNGGMVANMTLATSESWKDKQSGEIKEKTEWHRVVVFGKIAEVASEYLHKGSQIYIEGSLQTRKWQDQNGQDRYITEVIVNMNGTMQMLGSRVIRNEHNNTSSLKQQNNWKQSQQPMQEENDIHFDNEKNPSIDFDDDIPF